MAIWYGGSAFEGGNTVALTNALLGQAEQIAGGWRVYATDHGGNSSLGSDTDNSWGAGTSVLVPNYLVSIPIVDQSMVETTYWLPRHMGWVPRNLTAFAAGYNGTGNGLSVLLTGTNTTIAMCNDIARRARGSAAVPLVTIAGSPNVTPSSGIFDCYYIDVNTSGTLDSGDTIAVVYKVF